MIRESGSVRSIWSSARGPGVGGAGGMPRGFWTGALTFLFARLHLGFVVGPFTGKALCGARLDLGLRLADGLQPRLAPRQLLGDVLTLLATAPHRPPRLLAKSSPTSNRNWASSFSAWPYDRALWREALACILVPSKATVPSFKSFISFAMQSTCTNSASISLRNRLRNAHSVSWSGWVFGREVAKRQRVVARLLDASARKAARGITVDKQRQEHRRVIGRRARAAVYTNQRREGPADRRCPLQNAPSGPSAANHRAMAARGTVCHDHRDENGSWTLAHRNPDRFRLPGP